MFSSQPTPSWDKNASIRFSKVLDSDGEVDVQIIGTFKTNLIPNKFTENAPFVYFKPDTNATKLLSSIDRFFDFKQEGFEACADWTVSKALKEDSIVLKLKQANEFWEFTCNEELTMQSEIKGRSARINVIPSYYFVDKDKKVGVFYKVKDVNFSK